MKKISIACMAMLLGFSACKKVIDTVPQSNLNSATYYTNAAEVQAGLNGAYNGLQKPIDLEWQFTELRSDNSKQGVPASTNSFNRDLSDLDMFMPATTQDGLYQYWLASYNNIRNANVILQRLGVNYDAATGAITLADISIPLTDAERKQDAGEALFIRAYHYFNLVRLYGGVFLITKPVSAAEATTVNRSTVADTYKLIETDLTTAAGWLSTAKYGQIPAANIGRASAWAAKGLLGKVYLTQNKKAQAIPVLQDVVTNSGYGLETSYAGIFSITNEMNREIIFTIRFKAGGFGLGSGFGNDFGPLNSGANVINGSGLGYNTPTTQIDSLYTITDARKAVNIARYLPGAAERIYVKKYLNPVAITNDGESDWPILRFADVLLMLSEAEGNTAASVGRISQVRTRAALTAYPAAPFATTAAFEQALSEERRKEFAFENHRWFDIVRYGTTLSTLNAVDIMRAHFAYEYNAHYRFYLAPTPTLADLQAQVTQDHLLLPIPQHEIDTNTQLVIAQNPGY